MTGSKNPGPLDWRSAATGKRTHPVLLRARRFGGPYELMEKDKRVSIRTDGRPGRDYHLGVFFRESLWIGTEEAQDRPW